MNQAAKTEEKIMGIFSRMRDIISSNVNAMLDKAEDPEKLMRLMVQEMEDALIEIKAECAAAMAQSKTFGRQVADAKARANDWAAKAELAVSKGREDLAREALVEKRAFLDKVDSLEAQQVECDALIEQYQNDIAAVEQKIASVRERQKVLSQRHTHARSKKNAEEKIRRVNTADVLGKFESFERRVDQMEAEADLVNYAVSHSLEERFTEIETDEDIEKELDELRQKSQNQG